MITFIPYFAAIVTLLFGIALYYFIQEAKKSVDQGLIPYSVYLNFYIMKKILIIAVGVTFTFLQSCSSDSDEDYDLINDSINTKVTYTNSIKPIIDANCISCHGTPPINSAPMSLNTYDQVKNAVESRNLINEIETGSMPPVGNLSTTQIQQIKSWQSNGFPN